MKLGDRIEDLAFWIGLPTVRLTEGSPHKWVRVTGVMLVIPLAPLCAVAMVLLAASILIGMWDEI